MYIHIECVYIRTYTWLCACTYMVCVHIRGCVHVHIWYVYKVCVHTYRLYVCMYIRIGCANVCIYRVCICTCSVCVHTYGIGCVHVYVCVCAAKAMEM